MFIACILLSALWILYLLLESAGAARDRKVLSHVVHVNGTRGKTTTCRLIEAGLRAGGFRVFCKTTGTDPLTIDVHGKEEILRRHGKANIKEQIHLLRRAARQQAQVLVIECMALQPELQQVSQHRILKADIGVLTNVRRDHTDVMGETPEEICDVLCNTIPRKGRFFTGEIILASRIREKCDALSTEFTLAVPDGSEPDFDFAENIALALSVCEALGVSRETALSGMQNYRRDPYTLSFYLIGSPAVPGQPDPGAFLINGLSVNDIQSTRMILEDTLDRYHLRDRRLLLILNNRADRGSRTRDMEALAEELRPDEIWLLGAGRRFLTRKLQKHLPDCRILSFADARQMDFSQPDARTVILAAGNLAGQGRILDQRIRKEGQKIV